MAVAGRDKRLLAQLEVFFPHEKKKKRETFFFFSETFRRRVLQFPL